MTMDFKNRELAKLLVIVLKRMHFFLPQKINGIKT